MPFCANACNRAFANRGFLLLHRRRESMRLLRFWISSDSCHKSTRRKTHRERGKGMRDAGKAWERMMRKGYAGRVTQDTPAPRQSSTDHRRCLRPERRTADVEQEPPSRIGPPAKPSLRPQPSPAAKPPRSQPAVDHKAAPRPQQAAGDKASPRPQQSCGRRNTARRRPTSPPRSPGDLAPRWPSSHPCPSDRRPRQPGRQRAPRPRTRRLLP